MAAHQLSRQRSRKPDRIQLPAPSVQNLESAAPSPFLRHATIQRALADPRSLAPADVLQLQRSIGNRSVAELLLRVPAQSPIRSGPNDSVSNRSGSNGSGLRVGPANDAYERQAEQVAGQVGGHATVQRSMQPEAAPQIGLEGGKVDGALESQIHSAQRGGSPVPESVRRRVESRTGQDFRNVRVHNDKNSHLINDALGARAATRGEHIFLGRNQSPHNVQLMAHELTHVVQQTGGNAQPVVQRLPMRPQDFQDSFATLPGSANGKTRQAFLDVVAGLTTYYDIYDNLEQKLLEKYTAAVNENVQRPEYSAWDSCRRAALAAVKRAETGVDKVNRRYAENLSFFALTKGAKRINAEKRQAKVILDQLKAELQVAMGELADKSAEVSLLRDVNKVKTTKSLSKKAGRYNDKNLKTVNQKFGKGAINEVSLLEHRKTGSQYVFKADTTRTNMKALSSGGIDVELDKDVGYANRALAMYRIAQLLADPDRGGDESFDVIPETHFATKGGLFGHIMKFVRGQAGAGKYEREFAEDEIDPDLGPKDDVLFRMREYEQTGKGFDTSRFRRGTQGKLYVMDHAPTDIDYSNKDVQSGLTALQLIDLISGQVDRHPGNYIVETLPNGRVRVWGIDNDAAFGKGHKSLYQKVLGSKGVGLPETLSKAHAKAILSLKEKDVRAAIGDLLSEEEVNNTINRLRELQAHIRDNYDRIVVKSYGKESFRRFRHQAQMEKLDSQSSYVGRSNRILEEQKAEGKRVMEFKPVTPQGTGSPKPSRAKKPRRPRKKNVKSRGKGSKTTSGGRKSFSMPTHFPPLPPVPQDDPVNLPPLPSLPDDNLPDNAEQGGYYLEPDELFALEQIKDEDLGFTLL